MRTAHRRESIPACIRKGARAIERAKPFPEFTSYLDPFRAEHDRLTLAYNAWRDSKSAERIAIGELHVAESVLDNERRGLGFALVKNDFGHRGSERYRTYFSEGFGATLHETPRKSLAITSGIIELLGTEGNPTIAAHKAPLQAAYDALVAALANRQAAADDVGKARKALDEAGSEWRTAFNTFQFGILTNFPDRRSWIESISRISSNRRSAEDDQTEEPGDGTETEISAAPLPLTPVPAGGSPVPDPANPAATGEAAAA